MSEVKNFSDIAAAKVAEATADAEPNTDMTTAENAAEGSVGLYTHTFKKPFTYAGTTYKELTFNFERLTGRDMVSIEAEMQANNEYALAPEISRSFQAKMAAKAAGIGGDVLEAMPMNDFNRITNACRSFLLDSGY